jgi:flagellar biosynthesis regulator FlaF
MPDNIFSLCSLPFRAVRNAVVEILKSQLSWLTYVAPRTNEAVIETLKECVEECVEWLKLGFAIEEFGDDLWQYLIDELKFPTRFLKEEDRTEIVSSPLFLPMLEMWGRAMTKEPKYKPTLLDFEEVDS